MTACVHCCGQSLEMGLELLMALAEESEVQLTRAARTAMLGAIGEHSGDVLQLLGNVLAANVTAQGAHHRAVPC